MNARRKSRDGPWRPSSPLVATLREPTENRTTKVPLQVPRVACTTIRGATDWLVDDYVRRPDPSTPIQKTKQTVTPMIHCRIGGTVLVCLLPSPPSHRSRSILRDSATFRQRIGIGELRGDLFQSRFNYRSTEIIEWILLLSGQRKLLRRQVS